jgi:hypothetical protein
MAAKKKATKKTKAVAKRGVPGVPALSAEEWEATLVDSAKDASATASGVGGGALFINTRGGNLAFQGEVLEQPLSVFVLDQVRENDYYEGDFDPDAPRGPTCYAIGRDEETLAPPYDLDTKQADRCATCQWNKFGTADRGRGKACKNILRLALLPVSADPAALAKTEPAFLRVPTTSVKNFRTHAIQVEKGIGRPLWSVITDISTVDDPKTVWKMEFGLPDAPLANAAIGAVLVKRRDEIRADLERPPVVGELEVEETAPKKKQVRRKVVRQRGGKKR